MGALTPFAAPDTDLKNGDGFLSKTFYTENKEAPVTMSSTGDSELPRRWTIEFWLVVLINFAKGKEGGTCAGTHWQQPI